MPVFIPSHTTDFSFSFITSRAVYEHIQIHILSKLDFVLISQQAKKGVTALGGVIDSDYQREIGQLRKLDNYSTMGVRERVFGI